MTHSLPDNITWIDDREWTNEPKLFHHWTNAFKHDFEWSPIQRTEALEWMPYEHKRHIMMSSIHPINKGYLND